MHRKRTHLGGSPKQRGGGVAPCVGDDLGDDKYSIIVAEPLSKLSQDGRVVRPLARRGGYAGATRREVAHLLDLLGLHLLQVGRCKAPFFCRVRLGYDRLSAFARRMASRPGCRALACSSRFCSSDFSRGTQSAPNAEIMAWCSNGSLATE